MHPVKVRGQNESLSASAAPHFARSLQARIPRAPATADNHANEEAGLQILRLRCAPLRMTTLWGRQRPTLALALEAGGYRIRPYCSSVLQRFWFFLAAVSPSKPALRAASFPQGGAKGGWPNHFLPKQKNRRVLARRFAIVFSVFAGRQKLRPAPAR